MTLTLILVIVTILSCIATICAAAVYAALCEEFKDNRDEKEEVVRLMMRSLGTFVISFVLLIIKLIF